jgi:hypothetical protein
MKYSNEWRNEVMRNKKELVVNMLENVAKERESLAERVRTLEAAVVWALGHTNFGESRKPINAPAYWWRKELRERSGITEEEIQAALAGKADA